MEYKIIYFKQIKDEQKNIKGQKVYKMNNFKKQNWKIKFIILK